jgi:hypothetical protein
MWIVEIGDEFLPEFTNLTNTFGRKFSPTRAFFSNSGRIWGGLALIRLRIPVTRT